MTSGDWLPAQAPFDLVRRGFSPEQVTAHLERLEYDLRITTANRDATNQRLTELGAQLAAAQAEADTLRSQLDRSALEPVSMANLSDRMQRMIRLAEEEAGEIRARAEADADRLRGQLETALAEAADARSAFDAERERTRKQLAEQVHGLIAEATSEAEETRSQAQDEAAKVLRDANAEAERMLADARATAETQLTGVRTEAERITTEAASAAARLTAETAAERERLDAESLARRTQIEEDFEIAITARRLEANRVITERDEGSAAAAEKLVADARAHAEQLVATATAESDTLMRQATTYANALVNRASAESNQRVADADAAVAELLALRTRLAEQLASLTGHLDHIRELAASAPSLIAAPDGEQNRPTSAQFPADPADRPTATDLPVPVYGDEDATLAAVTVADVGPADATVDDLAAVPTVQLPDQHESGTAENGAADQTRPKEVNGSGRNPARGGPVQTKRR